MAKPNILGGKQAVNNSFQLGRVDLVHSADLDHLVYGGSVAIPRVIPETRIRLVPVAMQRSSKSPDYNIEVLEIGSDNKAYWASGGGVGWWREKEASGDKPASTRIDLLLNIGQGQTSVNATLWPADDDQQPEKDEIPEGYTKDMGPIAWRLSYSPPRPSGGRPAPNATPTAQLQDSIPY